MMKYILLITSLLLTGVSAHISSIINFADRRSRWYKYLKKNSWVFLLLNSGIAIVSGLQFYISDSESLKKEIIAGKKEIILNEKQRIRDERLRYEYNKTKRSSDSLMSEILAKYGLKFDSTSKMLVKVVRDSSKTKVIIPHSPKLSLCYGNEIERRNCNGSSCFYRLNVCSYDAGTTDYEILYDVVVVDSTDKFLDVLSGKLLTKDIKMSSEQSLYVGFTLTYYIPYDKIIMYVHGKYKGTSDERKGYSINDVYRYSLKEKYSTILTRSTKDSVVRYVEANRR